MPTTTAASFRIPGTRSELEYERDGEGRLVRLRSEGRTYLREQYGERTLGDGLAVASEAMIPGGILRQVRAAGSSWVEEYLWDAALRPMRVDGVEVVRDESGRLAVCRSAAGEWRYHYSGEQLVAIASPQGLRRIARGRDGRPLSRREGQLSCEIEYDTAGVRRKLPALPASWHRDPLGRLWSITDGEGNVRTVFLWDGHACLGRIDGPPGAPLAAAFSLDLSCTPVRVITAAGVTVIPRDGFGEGLLAHPGVPGLYGGASFRGVIHFRSRVLDPRTGAFAAPDPWHGRESDPRRRDGYRGPLTVERARAGPYAVAQNDPIGRADPTGEISFLAVLSDLTWSLQNNIAGWLGLDFTLGFWLSLFTGKIGRFFTTFDRLSSSDRLGAFAVKRDGFWSAEDPDRAWAFQHIVYAPPDHIEQLADVRCFLPDSRFLPTHYGSLLRVVPDSGRAFLLRGDRQPAQVADHKRGLGWSRAGGVAEPVIPGSPVPHFPDGALHFDAARAGLRAPLRATLLELEPRTAAAPADLLPTGTIDERVAITGAPTGLGLTPGRLLLLTGTAAGVEIGEVESAVESGGSTRISLATDVSGGVGTADIRMRGIGNPSPVDPGRQLVSATDTPRRLNVAGGTAPPYAVGDPLRLSQGGIAVAAALVQGLEAQIRLDAALPAGMSSPLQLSLAVPQPSPTPLIAQATANPLVLEFPGDPSDPGVGTAIVAGPAGNQLAVRITAASGNQRTVDRTLAPLGFAPGDSVPWERLGTGPVLGTRTADPQTGTALTYEPAAARSAPSAGFVFIEDSSPTVQRAARNVTGLDHDALVLEGPALGTATEPFDVERFVFEAPDDSALALTRVQTLRLGAPLDGDVRALHLNQLAGTALTAGAASVNGTVSGTLATGAFAPGADRSLPRPAQLVALRQGTNVEAALVRLVRVEVTFETDLALAGTSGLTCVPLLQLDSAPYDTTRLAPLQVEVASTVAGNPAPQLRFRVGERVRLSWDDPTSTDTPPPRIIRDFNVAGVARNVLDLAGAAALPADTPNLTALRFGAPAGMTYDAEQIAPGQVTILPVVGGTPVEMPRIGEGELVEASWEDPTLAFRFAYFRVRRIEGSTYELLAREPLPAATPELRITRLTPADPETGGSRLGVEGTVLPGTTPTRTDRIRFDVWRPDAFFPGRIVALVEGDTALPAVVHRTAAQPLEVEFAAPPALSGNLEITIPALRDAAYTTSFLREGNDVIIDESEPLLPAAGNDLIVVIPYIATARSVQGVLSPGTVLVPEDESERIELDRKQSLIDHELRHTLQSIELGPWLLAWFPLFALEGILEATTDVELPRFSAFVPATVTRDPVGLSDSLSIEDFRGIPFAEGDRVQIATSGTPVSVRLGTRDGNTFRLRGSSSVPAGSVSVRREISSATDWWSGIMEGLQVVTVGGATDLLFRGIYGGMGFGLAKLFYALFRLIRGRDQSFPVTLEEAGRVLRPSDPAGFAALRGASHLSIRKGDTMAVRRVEEVREDTLLLSETVFLTDPLLAAPYSDRNPESVWDWHDYFPGRIPDFGRPFAIRIDDLGARRLTLAPLDRVTITTSHQSLRTTVTAVAEDGTVELEDRPPPEFRIAKVGENDPFGNLNNALFDRIGLLGTGWMRWLTDPYGQLHFRTSPDPRSFLGILARSGRYLFSSRSWSMLLPGWWVWDNVPEQLADTGWLSHMEQDASEQSGDLYSPLGRIRGVRRADDGSLRLTVGDVARYRYWLGSRYDTVVTRGRGDAPGVHLDADPRLLPLVTAENDASTNFPNLDAQAAPAADAPGSAVPDALVQKNFTDPRDAAAGGPRSFAASPRGWIPTGPLLERTSGIYFAFTRAGDHRVTVRDGIPEAERGRQAQEEGQRAFLFIHRNQPLFFTVTAEDVAVQVAGLTVGPVPPGGPVPRIQLVLAQRAAISVLPNGERRYAATLARPEAQSVVRRDPGNAMELVAQTRLGIEQVEISRLYTFDPASGSFEGGGLGAHGMHLPADTHIPLRSFEIEVVDTLPFRSSPSTEEAGIVDRRLPGEVGFVLVPASILRPLGIAGITYPGGAPTGITDPAPTIAVEPTPDALISFIRDGGIFRVEFTATDPPEEVAAVAFETDVGEPGNSAVLRTRVEYAPHFRLELPGGGADFTGARGSTLALRCTDGVAAGAVTVTPSAGISVAVAGADLTLTLAADAAPGARRVLVEDAADPARRARRTVTVV